MVHVRHRLALLVAAALLVGACSADEGGEASPATVAVEDEATTAAATPTTTTTTTVVDAAVAAVERAYFEQWDAFVEIFSDPDPSNPLIDRYFAGTARETILDSIARDIRDNVITRLPENPSDFRPAIESLAMDSSETATVIECLVDGLVAVDRVNGTVLNDDVVVLRVTNAFQLIDAQWKVTSIRVLEELQSADECAIN
jgi:hypothetical protein